MRRTPYGGSGSWLTTPELLKLQENGQFPMSLCTSVNEEGGGWMGGTDRLDGDTGTFTPVVSQRSEPGQGILGVLVCLL